MAQPPRAPRTDLVSLLLDPVIDRGDGERSALRWAGGGWSYAVLAAAAGSAAAWLRASGVGRGDVVLIAEPDGAAWIALFLGLSRIGAVAAPLSPSLTPARQTTAAARLGPQVVVASGALARSAPRALAIGDLCRAIREGEPDPGPTRLRRGEPAYLLLTSGSSGRARWARHRVGDIAACVATYGARVLRLGRDDVCWSVASLSTSYGLGNLLYFPLAAGASVVLSGGGTSPVACAADCARFGVTTVFGVPTSWARLARYAEDGRIRAGRFRTVRLAVSAGEPLPPGVWTAVDRILGLRLVDGLGSSEASNLYLSCRRGGARPGSVGWPVPGYEVRLRRGPGDEDPREGELLVRGPTIMDGYAGEEGEGPVDELGWLATGDIVRRERDGRYRFVRRRGDRFKAGGFWVDPAGVRAALLAHEDVAEAVVMPVTDRERLQRVGAAVVLRSGADVDPGAVLERVAAGLRRHEVPRALVALDALPTTASGKLDRAEIRRLLDGRIEGRAA